MSDAGETPDRTGGEEGPNQERAARIAAARRRFSEVAALPDEVIDLAEGALLIAAEEEPDLDVGTYLARLDDLAGRVQRLLAAPQEAHDDEAALDALHRVLFEEEGFTGVGAEERPDPRNSFLNDVLERKRGLPITLSVVYCEVARRAGLDAVGIGLPGHFIVQFRGRHLSAFVDPFHGGSRLAREDCAALLARVLGQPVELTPEHFLPATRKATLARILNNLKAEYFQSGQLTKALAAVERILMLQATLDQVRDRGLILRQMGLILMGAGGTRGPGRRRREAGEAGESRESGADPPGGSRPAPDQADLLASQQFLSAAWFDLMLYAREGADLPDAEAVRSAADALWRRMAKTN
jgi:regulator of sirC expression with transglutaminase-like and TPR domain